MLTGDGKKQEPELKDFKENHTDTTVSFTIIADPAKIDEFEKSKGGLEGKFKLTSTISTANMHLFDTEGKITKYNSANEILSSFFDIRLEYYNKRKALLVERLAREKRILSNKARFVEEVCNRELVVSNRKRTELLADLKERDYELFPKDPKKSANDGTEEENEEDEADDTASDAELAKGYEYLLGMKIWSLTKEKADKLRQELAEKTKLLEELEATEPSQIWLNDLDAIEVALDERDEQMKENANRESKARNAASKRGGGKSRKAAPKKKKAVAKKKKDWDSDMEDSDDDSDVEIVPKSRAKAVVAKKRAAVVAKKPAAAAKKPTAAAKKPTVAKKVAAPAVESDADSDGELEVGLLERIKTGLLVSPQVKKRKESPVKDLCDSDSDSESETKRAKKAAPAAKKAAPAAKKSAPAAKKAAPKKKTAITLDMDDSEDDGGFGNDSDSEDSDGAPSPPAPRARSGRARATKAPVYDVDDSDESDDDFAFDE